MELQTIGQVSKNHGISARMLRYYEQIGLINSIRKDDNLYRFYDETAVTRLRLITLLRKLRISVKQIADILNNQNAVTAVEIFERNISEIDEEITSLSTVKSILTRFAEELRAKADMVLSLDLLNDANALSIIDTISFSKNYISNVKENLSMEELNKADEKLNKLTDRDVRIVYLPPATIASSHYIGDEPEYHAAAIMAKFVLDSKLHEIKPDLRQYGFNHPNPGMREDGKHGYEFWLTIPDDMVVPEPLTKKKFAGGLYAAHMIPMGAFEEWGLLDNWLHNNDKYEYRGNGDELNMFDFLEEHLNYLNNVIKAVDGCYEIFQLDLLVPIKEKN